MIAQLDWLIHPSPHIVASFTVCGENTSDLMTTNSMYTMQYYYYNHCPVHQIPELIHLVIKSLYPLTNISLFHPQASPCKHCSTLCFCKFDFFRFHISVRSYCSCHSLSALFYLAYILSLEKEMATHSSILAWRIPWTEEPGGLQSMGLQRVSHD